MSDLAIKVAKRYVAAVAAQDLVPLMDEVVAFHDRTVQGWGKKFDQALRAAKRDTQELPDGWVWQDEIVKYLRDWENQIHPKLKELDEAVEKVWLETDYLDDIVNVTRMATHEPYGKARIDHAISDFDFFPSESVGRDHIAYRVETLEEWNDEFLKWSKKVAGDTKKERRKAQKRIRRRAV